MNYTNIISLLIFLVLNLTSIAQPNTESCCIETVNRSRSQLIAAKLFINEFPGKKEQFYDNWNKGTIVFIDDKKALNCQIRYNKWKDELIWLRESDFKTGTVIKENVKAFSYTNNMGETISFVRHVDNNTLLKQDFYLEVLSSGNVSFYCHRKSTYIKSSDAFSDKYQYFLNINGKMEAINLQKTLVLLAFDESERITLKQLAKKNHLKFRKESQLAQLIDLYNKEVDL